MNDSNHPKKQTLKILSITSEYGQQRSFEPQWNHLNKLRSENTMLEISFVFLLVVLSICYSAVSD